MKENEERWEDQPRASWGLEEMRAEFQERLTGPQPLAPTPIEQTRERIRQLQIELKEMRNILAQQIALM